MTTPVFNRPREFNPQLQQQIAGSSKKRDLRDEFGLGEEDDTTADGGGSDNEDEQVSSASEDYEGLFAKYNDLLKANQQLESQLQDKNSRIDELQRLSKQSQAILVNKHKDLIKALSEEYEQNKGKWKIAMLESGGDAAKLEQKIKVMDLTKENSSLREQIKELELVAMDLMRDLQDAKEKAEAKGTTPSSLITPSPYLTGVKSPKGTNGTKGAKKEVPRQTSSGAPVKSTPGAAGAKKGDEKEIGELKKKLQEKELKIKQLSSQIQGKRKPGEEDDSKLREENERLREEIKKTTKWRWW